VVGSCRHPLTQLDVFLRGLGSHLAAAGSLPTDDSTALALLHHASSLRTVVATLVAGAPAGALLTVDVFESAEVRSLAPARERTLCCWPCARALGGHARAVCLRGCAVWAAPPPFVLAATRVISAGVVWGWGGVGGPWFSGGYV
jgi:hypothetical protein